MQPERHKDTLNIPITIDSRGSSRADFSGKSLWIFLLFLLWLILSITTVVVAETWRGYIFPFYSFVIVVYIIRFLVMREKYFKKKRRILLENNFTFEHDVFWNIHNISNRFPYICNYGDGMKAIFIRMEKGVIVGKSDDYDHDHYSAISEAYRYMKKKKFECIHIDYMDTVGSDPRIDSLFEQAENIENPDLKKLIVASHVYTQDVMRNAYASHDIYVFYSYSSDDLFWDELQLILDQFRKANFKATRPLNSEAISTLATNLLNISDFSVSKANKAMFKELNKRTNFIRPIWVENEEDGRVVLNKTWDEEREFKRVSMAEKKIKRKKTSPFKSRLFKKKQKEVQEDKEIDLFDD